MLRRRVLLLEPYLVGSHYAWADGWQLHSRHDITALGLAGNEWRRAMRSGAAMLVDDVEERVVRDGPFELVVGTNMLDLAGFLGLARRSIGSIPAVQFLHENQLSYPRQPGEALDTSLAWMQWRGLVAADEIWCNSDHHRVGLLSGLLTLDQSRDSPVNTAAIDQKMVITHVGVDVEACRRREPATGPRRPLVVSNQRWHHDKDVGSVLRALRTAAERGHEFDVALLGDPKGGEADDLAPLVAELGDRVVVQGLHDRSEYLSILKRADVVVSAARDENFGIAVVEAVASGAWPVVPHGLAYPEVVPPEFHDDCLYESGGLGARLRYVLSRVTVGEPTPPGLVESMGRFDWSVIAEQLDDRVDQLLARAPAV